MPARLAATHTQRIYTVERSNHERYERESRFFDARKVKNTNYLRGTKLTISELKTLIKETSWFQRLTDQDIDAKFIQIPSLAPWGYSPTGDAQLEKLADEMECLAYQVQ
jgi:hypothetical protein